MRPKRYPYNGKKKEPIIKIKIDSREVVYFPPVIKVVQAS